MVFNLTKNLKPLDKYDYLKIVVILGIIIIPIVISMYIQKIWTLMKIPIFFLIKLSLAAGGLSLIGLYLFLPYM